MTAPRLALITAVAATTLVLAGCVPSTPTTPAPDPTTAAPEPEVVQLADLEYPLDGEGFVSSLGETKATLLDWRETWGADCTAEDAGGADAPDCTEGILTGLQAVNGIKTVFDFSYPDEDWDSGDYSGLVALEDTRAGVQIPSQSGSDFIDTCYYVPGGDGSGACVDTAQTFLDDVDEFIEVLSTWEA